jgi:hypothetical protein
MKKIYLGLLIMLLGISSQSGMANTFATVSSYVPSWQTIKGSIPPAAYWPGIGAVAASTLALNPLGILSAESFGQGSIKRKMATLLTLPYALPYSLPQYLRLKRQFLAEHGYPEQALELPYVQAAWQVYVDFHLKKDAAARKAYWLGMPAALLLGGYLYNTYRK